MSDINRIAYRLQKVRKQLLQQEPDWAAVKSELYSIRNAVSPIAGGKMIAFSLTLTLDKIDPATADAAMAARVRCWLADTLDSVKSMKMKKRICRARNGIARQRYAACNIGVQKDLRLYDVILAPTEGGFHYSIIVRLDADNVWCLPYTTSSARSLRVMGRRYAKVSCPVGEAERIYLTNALSQVSRSGAECHFICRFTPSSEELELIADLLPRAWREEQPDELSESLPEIA